MPTTEEVVEVYNQVGTIRGTALSLGAARATIGYHLKKAGIDTSTPRFSGRVSIVNARTLTPPEKGRINRYLLTSAQNNTKVHERCWLALRTLAAHYDATIMIGTFTYNKGSYQGKSVKRGRGPTAEDREDLWYASELEPYIVDEQVELAPGLLWCGEMNILPTAVRPLSGLEVYTRRKSGIFPHVKVAMASVASGKHEPTKFNYTTGTVTRRNYIQKKAGLKADFHHVYGALLAEVDSEGRWFVRQVISDEHGVMCDLDVVVSGRNLMTGVPVKSIVWGDIHEAEKDEEIVRLAFDQGGMLDALRPEVQCMHDILDFRARNGHTARRNLIHDRFQAYILGHDSVEQEVTNVAEFLHDTRRDWCSTVVVDSNHDNFMLEWLRIGDYRNDPVNAIYFLELQLTVYKSIRDNPRASINLLRWAIERIRGVDEQVQFLSEDESFILDGVEHGMHGHLGPNGARGGPANLAKMGRRISRGHEHSASIYDGVYTAGLTGKNEQGYNRGPSSWSASHIVQYSNGKRAIYTMWGGKWRA